MPFVCGNAPLLPLGGTMLRFDWYIVVPLYVGWWEGWYERWCVVDGCENWILLLFAAANCWYSYKYDAIGAWGRCNARGVGIGYGWLCAAIVGAVDGTVNDIGSGIDANGCKLDQTIKITLVASMQSYDWMLPSHLPLVLDDRFQSGSYF